MMFKKKPDLPPRPPVPSINQIIEDLEHASLDDPVFAGKNCKRTLQYQQPFVMSPRAPELRDGSKDSTFSTAQEFMGVTHRLKELETLLIRQKSELEEKCQQLQDMGENIKRQSHQALQLNVCCNSE